MLNFRKLLCVLLAILSLTFITKSQSLDVQEAQQLRQDSLNRQRMDSDMGNREYQLRNYEQEAKKDPVINVRRPNSSIPAAADRAAMEKVREPSVEDRDRYASFLLDPDAGMFRLFPNLDCVSKDVIRVDGECANFVPDAWAYSFRQRQYAKIGYPDIRLGKNNLVSDSFLSQNILVNLGNVKIENISLAHGAVKYLEDFKPETEIGKIKPQYSQIKEGIKINNYSYTKSAVVNENTTYAARFIAYRCQINHPKEFVEQHPVDAGHYQMVMFDKREDIIVVFRIIRKESDGSITIVWKRLKHQESPKIVFN